MDQDSWSFASGVPSGGPSPEGLPHSVGSSLGRFQLRDCLGRGGMGVVYRAFDPRLGREVALKVVLAQRHEAIIRLLREAEALASLQHPGIVALHEVGEADGQPFLVCALVEGARDLRSAFAECTRGERVELVLEAADAIGYAHAKGFVHRDIKPDNVLVDGAGRVRVIDLGLVAGVGLERLTRSGAMVGTPTTMAPEQVAGSRKRIGPHSDVWALGVLLYLALTKELPFKGETLVDLVTAITRSEPTPPSALSANLPPALEACCLRALRKDRKERPPDGLAFAEDLRRALAAPIPRVGRTALAVAVGLALTLVLGGAILLAFATSPPTPVESPRSLASATEPPTPTPTPTPTATAARPRPPATKPPVVLRAEELLRTGRGDEALRLLDGALAEANHDVAMLCARAMIRANQAQTLGARADVDLALEFDPNCALAYRIRGMLRVPLGDYPGALQDVELAIRLDPSDRTARRNHASLLSAMNRLDEALKEFDSLLKSDPDDGASLVGRATTWEFKGEWKKCLRDVEKAIRLEPEPGSSKSHYLRARALRQLGRLPEALKALAKVLEIDPDDGLVFVERTLIWLSLGKPKLALSDAEAGVKHQPKDGAAWAHLGHARAMGGDHPGAIMAYEQGLELDPKMAPAWANLGAIRFQSEDYPGAIKALTRAIEIKHDPSALLNRGRAYAYAKDIKNALADFEHALRHAEPGSAEAREGERLAAMARAQLAR